MRYSQSIACHETLLLRMNVRGRLGDGPGQDALYAVAAHAVQGALAEAGVEVEVVRAAHPLDPRWKWPDDPVPNRVAGDHQPTG